MAMNKNSTFPLSFCKGIQLLLQFKYKLNAGN
jgi:hypothetical protein